MKVEYGCSVGPHGPGVGISLSGAEVATAIAAYLVAHGIHVSGPRTITVNSRLCEDGRVYVDPSGFVISEGVMFDGRGPEPEAEPEAINVPDSLRFSVGELAFALAMFQSKYLSVATLAHNVDLTRTKLPSSFCASAQVDRGTITVSRALTLSKPSAMNLEDAHRATAKADRLLGAGVRPVALAALWGPEGRCFVVRWDSAMRSWDAYDGPLLSWAKKVLL